MKVICIGRNYKAHVEELNNDLSSDPVVFLKPKSSIVKPGMAIIHPAFTENLHYECEIVLRISKNGKNIHQKNARDFFDRWTVGIDFTARDLQSKLKEKGLPWELSKSFDNSAAIGTFIPISNYDDLYNTSFSLRHNGDLVQKGHTSDMIFSFEKIISYVSKFFTLNIGDVIFTGTPEGVGQLLPYDTLEGYLNNEKLLELEVR
jgi:acylpyruvate hydrolase